jgi:single-stranded-DNA-specific exonuclease
MICELNAERQRQTEQWFEAATRDVGFDAANLSALPPLLASASEEYPHGIIGLIAGRLTEATGRPSIIATFDGEACVASLRSPPAYHITEGLERCADLLDRFGGHARAAGCTLRRDRWPELCERLRADIAARTQTADLQPSLDIDAVLDPRDVSLPLLESLRRLEPHGQGNPEPMFLLQNVRLESSRCVGQDQAHLQTRIGNLKAIGFRLGHMIDQCSEPLDVACRLALDSWQGQLQPQIIIADVRQAI